MVTKTKDMLEVEELHGEPLEVLLPQLFNEVGGTQRVANKLGVSRNTIYIWCRILGIVTRRGTTVVNGSSESLPPEVS